MPKKSKAKAGKKTNSKYALSQDFWFLLLGIVVGLFLGLLVTLAAMPREKQVVKSNAFVGMQEDRAAQKAERKGFEYRVVERDGEPAVVTDDMRSNRVNFTIAEGEVVKAKFY